MPELDIKKRLTTNILFDYVDEISKFFNFSKLPEFKDVFEQSPITAEGILAEKHIITGKNGKTITRKTIINRINDYKYFSDKEADAVAEYFGGKLKEYDELNVLRPCLESFLLAHCSLNKSDVKNRVNAILGEELYETVPVGRKIGIKCNIPKINDNSSIALKRVELKIDDAIERKHCIFLSGLYGSGKKFIAKYIGWKYYKKGYIPAIWIDCKEDTVSYSGFLKKMLRSFGIEDVGNLSEADMALDLSQKYLVSRFILIIRSFDYIKEETDKRKIIAFLVGRINTDNIILLTSDKKMDTYLLNNQRFEEIPVPDYEIEDWKNMSKTFNDEAACKAREKFPDIDDFVFNLGGKNPFYMKHLFETIVTQISRGVSVDEIRKNYNNVIYKDYHSFERLLINTIESLNDNSLYILMTLTLFSEPIKKELLSEISTVKDNTSEFLDAINDCADRVFIRFSDPYYSIKEPIRKVMEELELEKNKNKYKTIIENWIRYFESITEKIFQCHIDDYEKMDELRDDISNIKRVLEYCYKNEKFEDYYTLSQNTRYYFYIKGESGEGENSTHYRRSVAARKINQPKDEFNSLLYYCYASCKAEMSLDHVNNCFSRLDELLREHEDSIDLIKKIKYDYTKALYYFAKKDFDKSLDFFNQNQESFYNQIPDFEKLIDSIEISQDKNSKDIDIMLDYDSSLRWNCECICKKLVDVENSSVYRELIAEINEKLNKADRIEEKLGLKRNKVHTQLIRLRLCLLNGNACTKSEVQKIFENLDSSNDIIKVDAKYCREYEELKKEFDTREPEIWK